MLWDKSGQAIIATPRTKALKRIMHDWKEVIEDPPADSVLAFPDEKNMFEYDRNSNY